MKFQLKTQLPTLDRRVFQQKLDSMLTDLLTESARAWLQAGSFKVPVWSGAALSTFHELASRVNFAISVSPVAGAPDRRSLGKQESTGELKIDSKSGLYAFEYSTTLEHLIENETTTSNFPGLITPTPYNFREAALRAWEDVVKNARLPGLTLRVKGKTYG